jgi:uncharacterized protein
MSRETVEAVKRIYEAFAGDRSKLLEATDPEITCYDRSNLPGATVYRGHEGLLRLLDTDAEAFEGVRYEAREFIEAGDYVVVPIRQSGRGKASGVPVEEEIVNLWKVRDGKGVELRIYSTKDEALKAVGLRD